MTASTSHFHYKRAKQLPIHLILLVHIYTGGKTLRRIFVKLVYEHFILRSSGQPELNYIMLDGLINHRTVVLFPPVKHIGRISKYAVGLSIFFCFRWLLFVCNGIVYATLLNIEWSYKEYIYICRVILILSLHNF